MRPDCERNLFLYGVEVKVAFVAECRVAVWVHDNGDVLVDESQCEHAAVLTLGSM